jgi:hypothetical protein
MATTESLAKTAFSGLPGPEPHTALRRGLGASLAVPLITVPLLVGAVLLVLVETNANILRKVRIGSMLRRFPTASMGLTAGAAFAVDTLYAKAREPRSTLWTVGLIVATTLLAGAWAIAAQALATGAKTLHEIETVGRTKWPERWLYQRLRNPIDAYFVRFLLLAFSPLFPLAGAIASRGVCCLFLHLVALLNVGAATQLLLHEDIHQRTFRPTAKTVTGRPILHGLCFLVEWVLPLVNCWPPRWYRGQHILHHATNAAKNDPQATTFYDRTSYFDFCRAGIGIALDSTVGWVTLTSLIRQRKYRSSGLLILGLFAWLSFVALVSLRVPNFLLVAVIFRLLSVGFGGALTTWTQHGLVDPDDPTNVLRNTTDVCLGGDDHGGFGLGLHLQHTLRPGRHWSKYFEDLRNDEKVYRDYGAIVLKVDAIPFTGLVLSRQFDELSKRVELMSHVPLSPEQVATELRKRTLPLGSPTLPGWLERIDASASRRIGMLLVGIVPAAEVNAGPS